jgi:hypothetical protein
LIDSGASRDMTRNKEVLANFKEKKFSAQVELGDHARNTIKGLGSASFQLESEVIYTLKKFCMFLV